MSAAVIAPYASTAATLQQIAQEAAARTGNTVAQEMADLQGEPVIGTRGNAISEAESKVTGVPAGTTVKSSGGGLLGTVGKLGGDILQTAADVATGMNPSTAISGDTAAAKTGVSADATGADAVGDEIGSDLLSWLEPNLEKGALYFGLVVGGVILAGYGLVKFLEPTGAPQAVGRAIRRGAEEGAEE